MVSVKNEKHLEDIQKYKVETLDLISSKLKQYLKYEEQKVQEMKRKMANNKFYQANKISNYPLNLFKKIKKKLNPVSEYSVILKKQKKYDDPSNYSQIRFKGSKVFSPSSYIKYRKNSTDPCGMKLSDYSNEGNNKRKKHLSYTPKIISDNKLSHKNCKILNIENSKEIFPQSHSTNVNRIIQEKDKIIQFSSTTKNQKNRLGKRYTQVNNSPRKRKLAKDDFLVEII